MPHKDIKVAVRIFDTTLYRLDYFSKVYGRSRSELLHEFLVVGMNMATGHYRDDPKFKYLHDGMCEYVERVRWDTATPKGDIPRFIKQIQLIGKGARRNAK